MFYCIALALIEADYKWEFYFEMVRFENIRLGFRMIGICRISTKVESLSEDIWTKTLYQKIPWRAYIDFNHVDSKRGQT